MVRNMLLKDHREYYRFSYFVHDCVTRRISYATAIHESNLLAQDVRRIADSISNIALDFRIIRMGTRERPLVPRVVYDRSLKSDWLFVHRVVKDI